MPYVAMGIKIKHVLANVDGIIKSFGIHRIPQDNKVNIRIKAEGCTNPAGHTCDKRFHAAKASFGAKNYSRRVIIF